VKTIARTTFVCVVYRGVGEAEFPGGTLLSRRLLHHPAVLRRRLPQPQLARSANSQLFYRPLSRLARAVSHLCLCLTISKTLHTCQPLGLSKLISHYLPSRSVRSSNTNLLPPGITSNFSSRAFSVSAPSTWNSLPAHIRSIDTLSTFKRHVKFHLFQSAFTV